MQLNIISYFVLIYYNYMLCNLFVHEFYPTNPIKTFCLAFLAIYNRIIGFEYNLCARSNCAIDEMYSAEKLIDFLAIEDLTGLANGLSLAEK